MKMESLEKKVDEIANSRKIDECEGKAVHNLEESESPDAKRYQVILKAASEEMDLKMAEINGFMKSNEEEWQKSPKYH